MKQIIALGFVLPIFAFQPAAGKPLPAPTPHTSIVEQVQQGTCSRAEKECVRGGASENACAAAKAQCMKTGNFIGPSSGKIFGPFQKK